MSAAMSETDFPNIIAGLYNAKVAKLPLWMDADFWRYDQIDPWHDDATRIEDEARRGIVSALRVGHGEPSKFASVVRAMALKEEKRAALKSDRVRALQRLRPLAQLAQTEGRVRSYCMSPAGYRLLKHVMVPPPLSQHHVARWRAHGEVLARDIGIPHTREWSNANGRYVVFGEEAIA